MCSNVDDELEASEPSKIGQTFVASLKDVISGKGPRQEFELVRHADVMATMI
jgi:hypothetical protein